jgi:PIN domain nuclease of toxin-antitoxin system
MKWTRDPFDRLITAQAALGESTLLTKDDTIRTNYANAVW